MSQTEQNIEYVEASDLEPHQLNREIYTNRDISELVEKIDRHGFQEEHELLITPDNKILSGHRRWRAALELGITKIPVRRKDVDGDDALLTLLLANQYRDKTPAEKIREGEAWEKIEREKAKERNKQTAGDDPSTEKLPETETGETRDKVGEKIGVSGRTYERGKKVKEKADAGDETAQKEWEKLETGEQSISGAHSTVKKSQNETESEDTSGSVVENSWRSGEIESQEVQYRQADSQDGFVLHLDGTDYNIQEELLIELLA